MRALIKAIAVLAAVPLVLIPLYAVVPPPSTLMIADWLRLKSVKRDWVPLERISPNLVAAVIMSEDARFCEHSGVDWDVLLTLIDRAAEGKRTRGASTISMQTVKNLFLWPSRSYLRKALELPLSLYADLIWSKRRMIEIYLNIVEWDIGVYGAEAAAKHYFNKPAVALNTVEAARLAVTLPNPSARNPTNPSRGLRKLSSGIYQRMQSAGPYVTCVADN